MLINCCYYEHCKVGMQGQFSTKTQSKSNEKSVGKYTSCCEMLHRYTENA